MYSKDYSYYSLVPRHLHKMFDDASKADLEERGSSQKTSFPYIPLPHHSFATNLVDLIKPNMSVVDVGCGAGDKLWAFHKIEPTCTVYGIEHNHVLAKLARYICPHAIVIEANAFDCDYSTYDLAYMYRPVPDDTLQCRLQRHVYDRLRTGACLVIYYPYIDKDHPVLSELQDFRYVRKGYPRRVWHEYIEQQ